MLSRNRGSHRQQLADPLLLNNNLFSLFISIQLLVRVSEWLCLWINLWIDTWQVFWLILVSFVLMSSACYHTDAPRLVWINNSSGSHAIWPFKYAPFIAELIWLLVCVLLCAGSVNTINAHNIHTCYQMVIHSCHISDGNLFVNRKLSRCPRKNTFDTHAWPTWSEFSHCPVILIVYFLDSVLLVLLDHGR